jgi:hypothetical protein
LDKLLEVARIYNYYTEQDKEKIRSVAVNFFVSLEEILDYSLSFATWTLLSDHYGETKFKCNLDKAREYMAMCLNEFQINKQNKIVFDSQGKNTLYPLIKGFVLLTELCEKIVKSTKNWLRPENELPGYHQRTEIEVFPFLHKTFFLDLLETNQKKILELLTEITTTMETSNIANIRNRIEHKRPDFPTQEEIEDACSILINIIGKMEVAGLCPSIYLYAGGEIDSYTRGYLIFKDYKGREIRIARQSRHNFCSLPSIKRPLLIVPWIHIGDSAEVIYFEIEESSDYVNMWKDYPKRRTINKDLQSTSDREI